MRLLLDEDMQSKSLIRLLGAAGHDVATVSTSGIAGKDDTAVLASAKQARRVLLTRNGKDFLLLHQADSSHFGILVEYRDADVRKNMSHPEIVAAIGKIEESDWRLLGEFASINAWR